MTNFVQRSYPKFTNLSFVLKKMGGGINCFTFLISSTLAKYNLYHSQHQSGG